MHIPVELLLTAVATPVLTAIATLFWLLNKEKDKRISDRDQTILQQNGRITGLETTIVVYRDQIIPTIQQQQSAVKQLADEMERRGRGN